MIFEQIAIGGDRNFAYLVGDEKSKKALLVDPAYNQAKVLSLVSKHGLKVIYVANTHGHYDHSQLSRKIASATAAKVVAHKSSARLHELGVEDGDELELGSLRVKILHTPGHTADSICLLVGNKLMTGDTLFVGKVGGTNYGGRSVLGKLLRSIVGKSGREDYGAQARARAEYDSLFGKLLALADEIQVWPGHDYGIRPNSTIGGERRANPFLLCPNFEAFVDLKQNWVQYKREHGIK